MPQISISAHHPVLIIMEYLFSVPPLSFIKSLISATIAYPLAEKREKRNITSKLISLRSHYNKNFEDRLAIAKNALFETLAFSAKEVPYYSELFKKVGFNPESILRDIKYLQDIPLLTKKIIREEGERLYSCSLRELRHYMCKTGGSTGLSCNIAYDQSAADWSSAVTMFCRERVGNNKFRSELHFACRFPDMSDPRWPTLEDFKCFAMNRSNIFFDRLDDTGLGEIWKTLKRRKPYMVHAHPSTIYALACYIEKKCGRSKAFSVFESSGELLEPHMREKIKKILCCRIVDRYGLAELGVMGYELSQKTNALQILDSEGWPESIQNDSGHNELVFTGFHNRLMPLVRYATGDLASIGINSNGFFLSNVMGRIHDIIRIDGIEYPTHTIQDILDHRVGGIQEFQVDIRHEKPILRIVPEPGSDSAVIADKIKSYWSNSIDIDFISQSDLIRVGIRGKFRHVVTA